MVEKYYRFCRVGVIALLFASALLINLWFPGDIFEFPKFLALVLVVGILSFAHLLQGYFGKFPEFSLKHLKKETLLATVFVVGNIFAYIFSTVPENSLIGSPMRFQGVLPQIFYIFLAINSFLFFVQYKKGEEVFSWLKIVLLAVCLLALSPYLLGDFYPFYIFAPEFFYDRVYGTFGNPNYLAVFIVGTLPIVFWNFRKQRAFNTSLLILALVTLFLTGSRSAFVALIVSGLIFLKNRKVFWGYIVSVLVFFVMVLLVNIGFWQNSSALQRLNLDRENLTSVETRFSLWKAGGEMFLDRPIFGYGQDAIDKNIEKYLPESLKLNEVFYIDRTHNEFIDKLLTGGIFVFLSYVGLIGLILFSAFKFEGLSLLIFLAFLNLNIFHFLNFSTISSNILLYFFMGFLFATLYRNRIISSE